MTQTELNSLLTHVIGEARALSIPVSRCISPEVQVNTRARTRFGCCRRSGLRFHIEVSAALLEGEPFALRQVLAHEILHTCPGCSDHGSRWKGYAQQMNAAFGYAIRRADRFEDLGLTDRRPVRWLIVCTQCGHSSGRMKRSPLTEHPERYRCRCGGRLEVRPAEEFPQKADP